MSLAHRLPAVPGVAVAPVGSPSLAWLSLGSPSTLLSPPAPSDTGAPAATLSCCSPVPPSLKSSLNSARSPPERASLSCRLRDR